MKMTQDDLFLFEIKRKLFLRESMNKNKNYY